MELLFCQSCGMPLDSEDLKGTNHDGSLNDDYCVYCYRDGEFVKDMTMDEMIENCTQFIDEYNEDADEELTKEEAIKKMKKLFPTLKRWKND